MKKYIVVGAGVLGASAAYHLARAGARVTVIDRFDQGQATDAAAGIVCPWISRRRNKAWYRMVKGGARYYPELIKMLEADGEAETGYKRVGALKLHDIESKVDEMMELALKRREDAPEMGEITRLSPEETKTQFPALSEHYSAVHVSGGARVDGRALRNALISGAEKNGATFVSGDATLQFEGDHVTGVKVEGTRYEADQVIVTGGAWSKELLEPLGITFKVSFQKAQIMHLELPDTDTKDWPVLMPPGQNYLLSFANGRIVAGVTHEDDTGFDYRVTAGAVHQILDNAIAVAPGLMNSTLLETRVGFRPFTPGFLPVIGPVPNKKGLFVANGLGSSGLTSGPYLGAELARLALGEEMELDINDYDVAGAIE